MKIEINRPNPDDPEFKRYETKKSLRIFLRGLSLTCLLFAIGGLTNEIPQAKQTVVTSEPSETDRDKKKPKEKKSELFEGTGDEIFQKALDHPKDFIAQQSLAIEYHDPEDKIDFENLIKDQIQEIFDLHHQNLIELDRLFEYVDKAAPIILKEAKEQGVPMAIALGMAMHESKCNPDAHDSLRGAAGLFQIRKTTAESLGLKANNKTDERLDPTKNTRAAMTYLKQLHHRYGRWDLAMVAYNEGMTSFNHFLASIKEEDGTPFLEKVTPQNLQKQDVTYLSLSQEYYAQNKYPLNVEANVRLYLWYVYEKANQEQEILPQKKSTSF